MDTSDFKRGVSFIDGIQRDVRGSRRDLKRTPAALRETLSELRRQLGALSETLAGSEQDVYESGKYELHE